MFNVCTMGDMAHINMIFKFLPQTVFRYRWTSQWKWVGLPSCWNMNVGMFCNCGISHSCNMSRYVMPVTVSSAIPEYALYLFSCVCFMWCQSHPHWFFVTILIRWSVQIMGFLIMQFFAPPFLSNE
jgi:hypothetical protein